MLAGKDFPAINTEDGVIAHFSFHVRVLSGILAEAGKNGKHKKLNIICRDSILRNLFVREGIDRPSIWAEVHAPVLVKRRGLCREA